jgi:hypothetical protein
MSFLPVFPTRLLWMPSKNGPKGFQACLAAGTAPGSSAPAYTPSFSSGPGWNGFGGTSFVSAFRSLFASGIASSSSSPGSSGGGGSGGTGGGGGGGGGGGWHGNWRNSYRVAILCTRNGSPRGQVTLFFTLQYGQMAFRRTSFPSPVDPTIRIPRWQSLQRKIFCIRPPSGNLASLEGASLLIEIPNS